jgi:hypothetical protein
MKEAEMDVSCSAHGRNENPYKILVGIPEGKRSMKPRCRWEGNIRMDVRKIGWEGVDWIHLA